MAVALRDLHWVFPSWAALLGALGGWSWKWLRRYVLPISGGLLAWAYGITWYRCVGYTVATAAAFTLGYSPERNPWWVIALVGASYGATPLILRWRVSRVWWPVLTSVSLVTLMAVSLTFNWFTWKLVEMTIFGLHGLLVTLAIDTKDPDG